MEENISKSDSKRIATNTILLYIRMLFLMLIGLYTSRIVLASLGVEDYGIYNVVGGVVLMFTMISGALSASISRFITFELGKGDVDNLKKVFSSSVTIQVLISIAFLVLAETVGLWFVNTKLVISPSRMDAANWVYQFSIITFILNLVSIPYNAAIIAHERMSVFAYISIFEGIGKLLVAWTIMLSTYDKLIVYGILLMVIACVVRIIYGIYCKKHFTECSYYYVFDKVLLKRMFGFAGWNIIGATSAVCRDHGGNIVINLFCGTAVNGARAIAVQVSTVIQNFVNNFQTALNPQITKSYASGNNEQMLKLVFQGARFSYYILLIIALPVFFNADYLLSLWLEEVPDHTSNFLKLVLAFTLMESLSGPLMTTMYATEKVRNYQIVVGGIQLLNLPISYMLLFWGYPSESVFVVAIVLSFVAMVARLFMLKPLVFLSPGYFMLYVWGNTLMVTIASSIIPYTLSLFMKPSFLSFIFITIASLLITCGCVLYVGCSRKERKTIYGYVRKAYNRMIPK